MQLKNTQDRYGLIAKTFHWAIAFIIIGLLPVGLFMGGMENSPLKFEIYAMHKSFGLLVLFLGIARLAWRFVSRPPAHLSNHAKWEKALAAASHFWLYICIFGMPLSGWLMSSAGEFPVPFFGFHLPHIIGKDENLGNLFYNVHEVLGYTLLFVLALHMAGALKHHVIDRDETLQRMTYARAGIAVAAAIVLLAGASYAISGLSILNGMTKDSVAVESQVASDTVEDEAAPIAKDGWTIVKDKSSLEFKATLYGSEFTGRFEDFSGTIIFNPDALDNAKADIRINLKDVKTGDSDRDSSLQGSDWFDSEKYPVARFETTRFENAGDDRYNAIGTLTLRGVALPVTLPFSLKIEEENAHMTGEVILDRLDFGMGTGEWEDEKTVGHKVNVVIDLTATR